MEEPDKPASNNDLLVVEKRKTDTSMSYVKDEMSNEDLPQVNKQKSCNFNKEKPEDIDNESLFTGIQTTI